MMHPRIVVEADAETIGRAIRDRGWPWTGIRCWAGYKVWRSPM